jgi:NAD(P)-dependent dehydrogenase (short-subunit alcohol dehydrogenase family)
VTLAYRKALIVGSGSGLSAAVARLLAKQGLEVALAARNISKLGDLCRETGAVAYACDASSRTDVERLFAEIDLTSRPADVVVYNAGARARGPLAELDPQAISEALAVNAYGAFLVGQAAVRRMLKSGHGAILFTGASASLKGYAGSASFAMGKFALRGLAQSMARELAPLGIHVAHFVIDGQIARKDGMAGDQGDSRLDPDAIAASYLHVLQQARSAWTWEMELRPWVEKF